jgi:hypothetical protein
MNPSILRGAGIGLFVAGTIFTITSASFTIDSLAKAPKGYELIESSKLDSLQDELSTSKEQLAQIQLDLESIPDSEPEKEESPEESPELHKTVIDIRSGMNSIDVSLILEQQAIVKNQKDFEQYLVDNKINERIQIGQYELNSEMTFAEIAELITH